MHGWGHRINGAAPGGGRAVSSGAMISPPPAPQSTGTPADPVPGTPADPAPESPRPGLVGAVRDAGGVLAGAARLLWRHWPALIAIFLAGEVLRQLIVRGAVKLSVVNAELALLVLLLAPMTTLTSLVLMLRIVRPSLPWLGSGRAGKPPSVLVHLGSVLVPFMTIYYFEDDLWDDLHDYSYRVWEDATNQLWANLGESLETGAELPAPPTAVDRLPFDPSFSLAAVVVGAIVLRWLLGRWPLVQRHGWLGVPGAYLELVWLAVVTTLAFNTLTAVLVDWASGIRIGNAIVGIWEHGVGTASGATSAPEAAAGWLLGQLGHVDAVLVIPISWLAIAVVVVGLRPPARRPSGRAPKAYRQAQQKAQQRWLAAPRAIRWTGEQITGDLRERFTPLVQGVRMLVRAGAVPMLLFCLAFVAARRVADWLWQLERLLIGPQEMIGVWLPLGWPLGTLNEAIGTAVLVCLLAAAIDRVLHHTGPAAEPDPPAGAAEPAPAALANGQPGAGGPVNGAAVPPPPGPVVPPPPPGPVVPPPPGPVVPPPPGPAVVPPPPGPVVAPPPGPVVAPPLVPQPTSNRA